ncbi:MAG TPA: two-component system sensor histidine kinase NtrB [Candidatus Hypogeohydataceae bacterium YC38]
MNPTKDLFQEELIERLFWFIRLRWFAIAGVLSVAWVAYHWGLIGSILPFVYISLILLALNVIFLMHADKARDRHLWATTNARIQIISDLIILTVLLHFAGGAENPFLFYFVFHTILASILLERGESYLFAFAAIVLFGTMILLEYLGTIPHHCLLYYYNPFVGIMGPEPWKNPVYLAGTFFVFVTTMLISTYFTVSVATRLRERSRRLRTLQEELLRVEKDKWKAIVECMQEGVVFVDTEGKIAFYNASATAIKETALKECYPSSTPKTLGERLDVFKTEDPYSFQRVLMVGGRVYESTASSIKDSEGKHLGVVLVSRDITERREMERRLMHQEKMTVIGKLSSGIAHELNNPLGVISMFTQMALKKISRTEPLHEYLDTIRRNTEVCKKVIQSLLTYARMVPVHSRKVNLNDSIGDVLFMCRPLLEKHHIKLDTQLVPYLPEYEGDPDQLRQVFMNLVVNAIQAMEKGGELKVFSEVDHEDGVSALRLIFEDTGVGIEPQNMPRLFEPFFTTKPEGVGTGLGLSTCKNIVEGHGGIIEVKSELGRGSRFTILLPLKDGHSKQEEVPIEKSSRHYVSDGKYSDDV